MRAAKSRRCSGFTLIELLTVISIIGILAGLLMPALSGARERGRRIACVSNLRQIGIAIATYSSDFQNHTPTADYNFDQAVSRRPITWNYILVDRGYATPKIFQCPDDRRLTMVQNNLTIYPCSYGMVVGQGNSSNPTGKNGGQGNYWIGGSRITCPWLTNTATAIVGEFLSDPVGIQPTVQQSGNDQNAYPYMTSPSQNDPPALQPHSKHASNPFAANYLFMDGHVEWVERLTSTTSAQDPTLLQMFPPVPTPQNAPNPFVPCP